ncbi:MAG: PEP-CTERM sorting domain-containing protein [Acidobacteriaceae bacterium]|nr:PEP-CTERM sorting domain-containing protein [Acidobacteriaceae bacterium]
MRHLAHSGALLLLTFAAFAVPTRATIINFDAESGMRGSNLTGIPDSPLTIGIATFTGGELLNAEVGLNADQTGVYASEGLFGSGETNPLVINFTSPVAGFSVFVINGDDTRSYTVSDNLGDSNTQSLPSTGAMGAATFALAGNGLTIGYVTSANSDGWDFAIDNVSFTPTSTPEPDSLLLLGAGAVVLAAVRRKYLRGLVSRFTSRNRLRTL